MTLALPAAPQRAPRRQVLVATSLVASAGTMLMFGLLATWMKYRAAAPTRESSDGLEIIKDWLPASITIPEVAANLMLFTFLGIGLMAQWAVYSAKRQDAQHRSLALGATLLMGIAAVNTQLAVWNQMDIGLSDGLYNTMFYAITGTMVLMLGSGLAFTAVALFRSLGGRNDDQQVISAHALYWYFLTASFVAMWFVVYVQK